MAWPTQDEVVHNASIYLGVITTMPIIIGLVDIAISSTTRWLFH